MFVLAVLDFCCCLGFSLAVASRRYSLVVVHGLLNAVASLVSEHGLQDAWVSVVAAPGLWSTGTVVVAHRLSCSLASSRIRD